MERKRRNEERKRGMGKKGADREEKDLKSERSTEKV